MLNLCGRYVAYATPLLAICYYRTCDFDLKGSEVLGRKIVAGIIGAIIVCAGYEYLYVQSPGVEQSSSWLTGIRAADNAGFTNLGFGLCVVYCVSFIAVVFLNHKASLILITVLMCIHSFAAIFTCEDYHATDYSYSSMIKKFCNNHEDEKTVVYCTDGTDYTFQVGYLRFYNVTGRLDNIYIGSLTDIQSPIYFDENECDYLFSIETVDIDRNIVEANQSLYEGDIEDPAIYYKWNSNDFDNCKVDVGISYLEGNSVEIYCEGDTNMLFVCGTYVLPRIVDGKYVRAKLDIDQLSEKVVSIYNLKNLTVCNIELDAYNVIK